MPDEPVQPAPAADDARGPRGSYSNGRRKRAELVSAAFEVFAEKGFQRLSIRQIAEQIGTSHTALLHHFGSKDALLEAVLELREERDGPWRQQLLADRGFLAGVPDVIRRNAQQRGVIQLDAMLKAESVQDDHPAHEFVQHRDQLFLASVRQELAALQQRGEIRAELDLDITSRQVVSLLEGLETSWLHDPSIDMAAHMAAFLDLLRTS